MGLLNTGINEIIATTRLNAAPVGIINRGGKLSVMLYSGSHTCENVIREGWLVANYIFDPVIYVETAFTDLPADSFMEMEIRDRRMFRLKYAEAWTAFGTEIRGLSETGVSVRLLPLEEEVVCPRIHPVNRGFGNIIDATVHATRYMIDRNPEMEKLIRYHLDIVRKCGGERELEAMKMLEEIIKKD